MNDKTDAELEAAKAKANATAEAKAKRAAAAETKTEAAEVEKTPAAPEVVAQHEQVDAEAAKRNEENREGHERNMMLAQAEAEEAQARTQHADDPRAKHVPTGKQRNRNTPRVLPDGTKVWE